MSTTRLTKRHAISGLAIATLLAAGSAATAQNYCTNVGCGADYLVWNASGGNEGVYSQPSGEYDTPYDACGHRFYVNRRSVTRFVTHFLPGGRLERRSDSATLCRWGTMQ